LNVWNRGLRSGPSLGRIGAAGHSRGHQKRQAEITKSASILLSMKNPSGSEIMGVAARDRLHRPFPLREKNGQPWRIRVHGSIRKDWIEGAQTGCAINGAIGVTTRTGGGGLRQ